MHAILALEKAIGIFALYLQSTGLDAGIISIQEVAYHTFISIVLCPTHIHAHEHLRPVLGLCTASSGINLQYCIHGIFLLAQHVLQFERFYCLHSLGIHAVHLGLGNQFLLIEIEGCLQLVGHGAYLFIILYPLLQSFDKLHLRFCSLLVIPEAWRLGTQLFLFILHLLGIDIQVAVQLLRSFLYVFQLFCCNHYSLILIIPYTYYLFAPCSSGRLPGASP